MTTNQVKKDQELLTIDEAAEYLRMTISRVRYEVFIKRIPHLKIGKSIRFRIAEINSWLSQQKQGGQQ